jgi:branched-chain amino acid transport system ATP-binding protein
MNMPTYPHPNSKSVLSARALCKNFGGIKATQSVDLDIFSGDRHALIGPNGAGKTTLINLLTGVLAPSSGKIELLGEDISNLAPHLRVQRGLVRTFQINQLFMSMTPIETLTFVVSKQRGLSSKWWSRLGQDQGVLDKVHQLLEQFHLSDVAHQAAKRLSYGKQRLLEIAIALACEPKVLLLDEPVAGVPAGERDELLATVDRLPSDVSILLIEHDMDLVFSFAKQMTVLVNGGVLCSGEPAAIAKDERVKEVYLGHSAVRGVPHE